MLENKKYLVGNCFRVLLLQNKLARLLKPSWLSLDGISTGSVLIPRMPPCSLRLPGPTCLICTLTFIRK